MEKKPKWHCSVCNKIFSEPIREECPLCGSKYIHHADATCLSMQRPSSYKDDATGSY